MKPAKNNKVPKIIEVRAIKNQGLFVTNIALVP
jgi:hypothetical protein